MSPVPASPSSPLSRSRTCSRSSSVCRASQSTAPGSTVPLRVAITRPSSGVNPIVVVDARPSRSAAQRLTAAEVGDDDAARLRARAPASASPTRRRRARGSRRRGPDSRSRAGSAYVRAAAGMVAWNAVSKQATWGTPGQRRAGRVDRVERGRLVQGRELDRGRAARLEHGVVDERRRRCRSPPCTTRWATASGGSAARASSSERVRRDHLVARRHRASFSEVEPALTTRTSSCATGPGVSAATPSWDTSGRSSPCSASRSAPGSGRRPSRWRSPAARGPRPATRSIDVHHEVVPVEVVEHDHVERRGGRALLLVAADVEAVVVAAPVGEPVDEPRVAVEGEDRRAGPR